MAECAATGKANGTQGMAKSSMQGQVDCEKQVPQSPYLWPGGLEVSSSWHCLPGPFALWTFVVFPLPIFREAYHTYKCSIRGVSVVGTLELIWEWRWSTRSRTSVPRNESYWGRGKTSTDREWIQVLILCRFQRH